jgi:hypothetical protein
MSNNEDDHRRLHVVAENDPARMRQKHTADALLAATRQLAANLLRV